MEQITKEDIFNLYHNHNLSLKEVSKKLNSSVWKVFTLMNKYNIKRRKFCSKKQTDFTKLEIEEAYINSNNLTEAAQKLNIKKNLFRRYMRDFNIDIRTKKELHQKRQLIISNKIKKLYENNMSVIDIAKKLNISEPKVYGIMDLFDIKKRTKTDSLKLAYRLKRRFPNKTRRPNENKYIPKEELNFLYYNKNLTMDEISKQLDVGGSYVRKLFKQYNIKIKKRHGNKNSNWKGGIIFDGKRKLIYSPSHPNPNVSGKYKYEYRLIMEKHTVRFLTEEEVVHHIDGNVTNNKIENLQLCRNQSDHAIIPRIQRGEQ